jgi:RNA polymerase sigma factor (sigma-70 family)
MVMSSPQPSSVQLSAPQLAAQRNSKNVKDYMELVETVARVEYSRLPNHLIDQGELVNIGAMALYVMFEANPDRHYNVTYLSTAMKWAIRNELRNRYKWYALKQADTEDDGTQDDDDPLTCSERERNHAREAVYESILSVDSLMDAENPHEMRDDNATPDEVSELKEAARMVRMAIARLPERDRDVLEARFFRNLKMREIGIYLGISPSRTSRVVQSALDKVKVELRRMGFAE